MIRSGLEYAPSSQWRSLYGEDDDFNFFGLQVCVPSTSSVFNFAGLQVCVPLTTSDFNSVGLQLRFLQVRRFNSVQFNSVVYTFVTDPNETRIVIKN
jgi:hypothetical protein